MNKRLTIRLSDTLAHQVETMATQKGLTLSDIMREALQRYMEPAPPVSSPASHTAEECAATVLAQCRPAVQARMAAAQARTRASLMRLLPGILDFWSDAGRNPHSWTPDHGTAPPVPDVGRTAGFPKPT